MRAEYANSRDVRRLRWQVWGLGALVLQMMAVGEETGALDDLFVEVADFYEQEVDYDLKQLADAIEPILIVAMGVMVLILALGVFLPMWELASAAKGR